MLLLLLQQIPGRVCRFGQQQRRRGHQAEREQPVGQPRPASAAPADPLAAGAGLPRPADHAERTHQEEARGAEGKLQVSAYCIAKMLLRPIVDVLFCSNFLICAYNFCA